MTGKGFDVKISEDGIDVLLSFDTTGSMYPCLTQVRRDSKRTVRRLHQDIPGLRIAVIAHGDYCDAGTTYVTKSLDFTSDVEAVCRFIDNVGATHGGDSPECYELVLNEARSLRWKAGKAKAFVMIGDDVPHEINYPGNKKRIDWKNELKLLLEAGINVYGVHAMPGIRRASKWFYEAIAKETHGCYLTLDQFEQIPYIISAICYKQQGNDQLNNYQEEVTNNNKMNRNMAQVFQSLGGKSVSFGSVANGLVPVPSGRFQVLHVDHDTAIKEFVLSQGANFRKGRGFYEFTKSETVQEKKEVVLRDKLSGDMFTGSEAREMIGLPYGLRGKIKPTIMDKYDIFVQSTSVNRKLIGGTMFLYEVEDWER